MFSLKVSLLISLVGSGFSLIPAGRLSAAEYRTRPTGHVSSSFSDLDLEVTEARVTLEKALNQNTALRERLAVAETANARLTEGLAIANSEAEVFRRQTGELKIRMEALGVETAGGNTAKLEQRLLTALSDLRLLEGERKKLAGAVTGLAEAVSRFLKTSDSTDTDARLALETQLRRAGEASGSASASAQEVPAAPPTLTDGMIISVKDELQLIVANFGSRQGVRVGMPFQVLRGENVVGTVRVVDVRDKIAGALIQNLKSERDQIKVGDRLKVAAQQ